MSDPSFCEINMEIDLTKCSNEFAAIAQSQQLKEASELEKNRLRNFIMRAPRMYDDYDDEDERRFFPYDHDREQEIREYYDKLMTRMGGIFSTQPRAEEICEEYYNKFVASGFTTYIYENLQDVEKYNHPAHELHEESNDLKYIIDLCGSKLICLDAREHCYSQVIPLINNKCPNLVQLRLMFKKINNEDFENAFSKLLRLKRLVIHWRCDSPLPTTLVRSLKQIGGNLKYLNLTNHSQQNDIFLPDLSALAFSRLTALKELIIVNFGLRQSIVQSISEMKNLVNLNLLMSDSFDTHSLCDEEINMSPIGNLKNLENLRIRWNRGVEDKFLINLSNNAEQLKSLSIIGTNITNSGIIALNKLTQLDNVDLGLTYPCSNGLIRNNKFITDRSIGCLSITKLSTLYLSNCIKITNESVIQLFESLPSLRSLYIQKTNVTSTLAEEIPKSTKCRQLTLFVFVSFEDCTGTFASAAQSFNIFFKSI